MWQKTEEKNEMWRRMEENNEIIMKEKDQRLAEKEEQMDELQITKIIIQES